MRSEEGGVRREELRKRSQPTRFHTLFFALVVKFLMFVRGVAEDLPPAVSSLLVRQGWSAGGADNKGCGVRAGVWKQPPLLNLFFI
jgi:hypothetical protein